MQAYPHELLNEESDIFSSNRNRLNAAPNDIALCDWYYISSPISNIHNNSCHLTLKWTLYQSKRNNIEKLKKAKQVWILTMVLQNKKYKENKFLMTLKS